MIATFASDIGPIRRAGRASDPAAPFRPLHVVLMGGAALGGFAAFWLHGYDAPASHDAIAVLCGGGVIGLMLYARYALGVPFGSASMVYLALFWMFHYGLVFTAVLVPSVLGHYADWQIEWLYSPGTRAAMLLAWLGAVGFVAVLGLFTRVPQPAEHHPDPASRTHDPALYWIGWLVMLAGIAESAVALRSTGGLGTLALSYGEFRATTLSTTNFQAGINTSQIGCLLALCGAGGRRWIAPLATWAPFGAGLLLLGLRTDVLVPLVSFVIVLTHRGVRFRRGVLVAGVLAALIVIPAIKAFREVGFSNRERVDWTQVSPLATLTELGGTLHATKAYVDWIAGGDEPLYGASYWAPVDRQLLARILPGREQIPAIKDSRIPARDMGDREGSIGASSTGEAYYNFGAIGPLIFYALIGALFGWLDRGAAQSAYGGALLGIAMALFFFNIRDQWLPIPGRAAVALGVLAACRTIGWLSRGPTAVSVESGACS